MSRSAIFELSLGLNRTDSFSFQLYCGPAECITSGGDGSLGGGGLLLHLSADM